MVLGVPLCTHRERHRLLCRDVLHRHAVLNLSPLLRDHREGLRDLLELHNTLPRDIRETPMRHLTHIVHNDGTGRVILSFRVGVHQ
jgi:hypothetical protein